MSLIVRYNGFSLCLLLIIVPGCKSRKQCMASAVAHGKKKKELVQTKKNDRSYALYVEGVECSLCAQSVVDSLKQQEEWKDVTFVCLAEDYKQGYVRIVPHSHNQIINRGSLEEVIAANGFALSGIKNCS